MRTAEGPKARRRRPRRGRQGRPVTAARFRELRLSLRNAPDVERIANHCPIRVRCAITPDGKQQMAKPNYQFEKRQRELQKKRKKEAKARKKAPPGDATEDGSEEASRDQAGSKALASGSS